MKVLTYSEIDGSVAKTLVIQGKDLILDTYNQVEVDMVVFSVILASLQQDGRQTGESLEAC